MNAMREQCTTGRLRKVGDTEIYIHESFHSRNVNSRFANFRGQRVEDG